MANVLMFQLQVWMRFHFYIGIRFCV